MLGRYFFGESAAQLTRAEEDKTPQDMPKQHHGRLTCVMTYKTEPTRTRPLSASKNTTRKKT
eukprot:1187034-Ditylum_brightwellii.AAC.1